MTATGTVETTLPRWDMSRIYPVSEPQTRPKLETILSATTVEAHARAVSALDATQRRKYADLVSRISPAREQRDVADVLANPLSAELKEKMRSVLAKAIAEDQKTNLKMWGGILQQIGAFFGMSCFTILAARRGRRISFLIALLLAWGSLVLTFATFHEPWQIWYLWPLLGFCTLAPFGGYAIYFPELFPTRLRTTGTSFCYNVGRYITAFGVSILGPLNLPSTVPLHASQMYAKNVAAFLGHIVQDGTLRLDFEDQIIRDTCVTHAGEVRKS